MKGINTPPHPTNFRFFFFSRKKTLTLTHPLIFNQENRLVSENVHLYVTVRSNSVSPL